MLSTSSRLLSLHAISFAIATGSIDDPGPLVSESPDPIAFSHGATAGRGYSADSAQAGIVANQIVPVPERGAAAAPIMLALAALVRRRRLARHATRKAAVSPRCSPRSGRSSM